MTFAFAASDRSPLTLTERYDAALLDVDGVLVVGRAAVPGAAEAVAAARSAGLGVGVVTNNSARSPGLLADELSALGVCVESNEVVTSAQVAARHLARLLAPGSAVLVIGADSLRQEIRRSGLRAVDSADDEPVAVVQGLARTVGWAALAEAAVAITRGCPWVATNADPAVPSARGPLPGNGAFVAALEVATGRTPTIVGKPHPAMHQAAIERLGSVAPVVVGDRLGTDIAGANAVGCDSLLVLSGVSAPADLLGAPVGERPTYIGRDVRALTAHHPDVTIDRKGASCRGFRVHRSGAVLQLSRRPQHSTGSMAREFAYPDSDSDSDLDALRALCGAAWTSEPPLPTCSAAEGESAAVLQRLGLG